MTYVLIKNAQESHQSFQIEQIATERNLVKTHVSSQTDSHGILLPFLLHLRTYIYFVFFIISLHPCTIYAKEASTSEEFAINLWSNTCAVAFGKYEKFAQMAKRDGYQPLYEGQEDLKGPGGLAWILKSREFGTFIVAWRKTGACLIATNKSDANNAKDYFDEMVAKSVPKEWKTVKSHKALSEYSERITYRITSRAGRKIEYEIIMSSKEGGRQLVIYTKYQQPGEVWVDW